jgi:hypothetical protein
MLILGRSCLRPHSTHIQTNALTSASAVSVAPWRLVNVAFLVHGSTEARKEHDSPLH